MALKVLLVIDVQNDFCPGGNLAVPDGDQVVSVVNKLMSSGIFDCVVATKDWHPAEHQSFAVNHPGKNIFEQIDLHGIKQVLWPAHCVQGTDGAEFHPELMTGLIDKVIEKGTNPAVDSYSGFYENDGKSETRLRSFLEQLARDRGVPMSEIQLTVCGLATDYCVAFTARDGRQRLGLDVEVVVDGCRAVNLNPGDDIKTLRELAAAGIKLVESRTVLEERGLEREVQVHPQPGRSTGMAR